MPRYVCLLRAVNVSGARKLKMTELSNLCVSLGYHNVETYLQSGNVVLDTSAARSKLGPGLSAAIRKEFGYTDVGVLVWSAAELDAIIQGNPFLVRGCDPTKLHVTFLAEAVERSAVEAIGLKAFLPDEFASGNRAIYVHCPNGYGRTKLNNAFFERKLGVSATTRNWQSVTSLLDLAAKTGAA